MNRNRMVMIALSTIFLFWHCAGENKSPEPVIFQTPEVRFTMYPVEAKILPTGSADRTSATVVKPFLIAETEVTYRLWSAVRDWAVSRERGAAVYNFANQGRQGGDLGEGPVGSGQHPVTNVSWRDALVWTNALTEWANAEAGLSLTPVYYADSSFTKVIRDSRGPEEDVDDAPGSVDNPVVRPGANGFRIPAKHEWELAARFRADRNNDGDILDDGEFYPGNCASGALTDIYDGPATKAVTWYYDNAADGTHPVASLAANALGLYDMSGNVYEWCFDWDDTLVGLNRSYRGGSWASGNRQCSVGVLYYTGARPFSTSSFWGFRFARDL